MALHPPLEEPSDDVLVRRVVAGDAPAYGELVRRHQGAALRLAAAVCGSTEEARDIVQDAMVQGYRSIQGYRAEAPVRSWLLRIVANHAKNAVRARVRRRRREERHEVVLTASGPADPVGDGIARAEEAAMLLSVLARLSSRDREVLACRFVTGLSEAETGYALDIPSGTVKSRTARALAHARTALEVDRA